MVLELVPTWLDTAFINHVTQMDSETMSSKYKVWFNGEIRDFEDSTVHIQSHAIHYGSSVFEGIRAYETPQGTAIFRLDDHLKRLYYSASIYRMPIRYSFEELRDACLEAVRINGLKSAYLRPIVMRGDCGLGLIPKDMDTEIPLFWLIPGVPILEKKASKMVSVLVLRPGNVSHPIPFQPAPRRAAIICPVN